MAQRSCRHASSPSLLHAPSIISPACIPINKAPTDPISLQQLPLSHTQAYHQGTSLRISQGISAVKIAWPIHHSPTSSFISLSPPLSVVRTSIYPKMSNHICLSPSFTNLSFLTTHRDSHLTPHFAIPFPPRHPSPALLHQLAGLHHTPQSFNKSPQWIFS